LSEFSEAAHEQDRFFGVRRVVGEAAPLFGAAVMVAYLDAVDDIELRGTDLPVDHLMDLMRGAWVLCGLEAHSINALPDWRTRQLDADAAERRWKVGHRLFFVLNQGILARLGALAEAVAAGDAAGRTEALRSCSLLLRAAGAALHFTADFAPEHYLDRVRPSMMPPHVPPGFSGLDGRDHQVLIEVFRELRPVFSSLADAEAAIFRDAARCMLESHSCVCDRFGGAEHPSLRMLADDADTRQAASGVLRRLNQSRERLLRASHSV
jgi:hypothetical protein